ncbi:MAG: hypothetical protein ACKVT1_17730 [Dehalococcoidia bacterium]
MQFRRIFFMGAAALALTTATAFAACGGDDDSGGSSGGDAVSAGSGSDADYVAGLCKALIKFQDSILDLASKADAAKSESDAVKLLGEPLDAMVKDLEKVKPPSDLKDYHKKSVAGFKTAAENVKKGKVDALDSADLPDAPAGASERLDKVAAENADCVDAGVAF